MNVLLFAFKQAPPQAITDELEMLALRLQMRLLLDFPRYLRRICQGYSLSGDQDTLEMELAATFCSPSIGVGGEELDFPILNRRFED